MQTLTNLNITYWLLQTVAMLITAILIPKLRITSIFGAVLIVIALAFVNSKVWDAALFFSVPNELSYHSVLLFITNGVIFWILIKILPGIEVSGFLAALVAPVVFTLTSLIISKYANYIDWMAILDKSIEILSTLREYFKTDIVQPVTSEILNKPENKY